MFRVIVVTEEFCPVQDDLRDSRITSHVRAGMLHDISPNPGIRDLAPEPGFKGLYCLGVRLPTSGNATNGLEDLVLNLRSPL